MKLTLRSMKQSDNNISPADGIANHKPKTSLGSQPGTLGLLIEVNQVGPTHGLLIAFIGH